MILSELMDAVTLEGTTLIKVWDTMNEIEVSAQYLHELNPEALDALDQYEIAYIYPITDILRGRNSSTAVPVVVIELVTD